MVSDYELTPVGSLHASAQDRERLYVFTNVDGAQAADELHPPHPDPDRPVYGDFIQGVRDHSPKFTSSPAQTGALATFAPPMKGLVVDDAASLRLRRSLHVVLKRLNMEGSSDDVYDGWPNLLRCLPFTILQHDGEAPNFEKREVFCHRDISISSMKLIAAKEFAFAAK